MLFHLFFFYILLSFMWPVSPKAFVMRILTTIKTYGTLKTVLESSAATRAFYGPCLLAAFVSPQLNSDAGGFHLHPRMWRRSSRSPIEQASVDSKRHAASTCQFAARCQANLILISQLCRLGKGALPTIEVNYEWF